MLTLEFNGLKFQIRGTTVPIEVFFTEDGVTPNESEGLEAIHLLCNADVVTAWDVKTQAERAYYGLDRLLEPSGPDDLRQLTVLRVEVDATTSDYARLSALVERFKRHIDQDSWLT